MMQQYILLALVSTADIIIIGLAIAFFKVLNSKK